MDCYTDVSHNIGKLISLLFLIYLKLCMHGLFLILYLSKYYVVSCYFNYVCSLYLLLFIIFCDSCMAM